MEETTVCTNCNFMLKIKSEWIGKTVKCPKCSNQFVIKKAGVDTNQRDNLKKYMDNLISEKFKEMSVNQQLDNVKEKFFNLSRVSQLFVVIGVLFMLIVVVEKMVTSEKNKPGSKWVDYGNGMINIDNCKYINPKMNYSGPSAMGAEMGAKMANAMFGGLIGNAASSDAMNAMNMKKEDFDSGRKVSINAAVVFDDFTLVIENRTVNSWGEYSDLKDKLFSTFGEIKQFIDSDKAYYSM